MDKIALAAAAHPDDIEFMMAGTLALLRQAGWQLHYLNVANGSCGTVTLDKGPIVQARDQEARSAAAVLGARFHPPLVDDIEIYYERGTLRRLAAIVRQVRPVILLLPSLQDYMEDHTNAARLMVTAAFCRNMRSFPTDPPTEPVAEEMAVYHAMPYGLRDALRHPVEPDFCVEVAGAMETKRQALSCHRTQKEWLDRSQGLGSYLRAMEEMAAQVARRAGRDSYAEGWRRHLHLGFGPEEFDPLREALAPWVYPPSADGGKKETT